MPGAIGLPACFAVITLFLIHEVITRWWHFWIASLSNLLVTSFFRSDACRFDLKLILKEQLRL